MKKFLIFMLLVMASFAFTSCSWLDDPADTKIVGVGQIQNDCGLMIVDIDGVKYAPTRIYTNSRTRDGATRMDAIEGMEVTVFYVNGNKDPRFIAGEQTKEYLDEYFSDNYTFPVLFFILILLFGASIVFGERENPKEKPVSKN